MASSNSSMASLSDIAMEVDEISNSAIQMPNEEEDEKMDIDIMDEMPNRSIQMTTGGEDEEMDIDALIQMFRGLSLDPNDEMEWD